MDYQEGKAIVTKLQAGLKSGVPARFGPDEEGAIRNLIETDMVSPKAFSGSERRRFESQDIGEPIPVTSKGTQLFR